MKVSSPRPDRDPQDPPDSVPNGPPGRHARGTGRLAGSRMRTNSAMVWEERWHPLREEWVIVAAHRQNRPWIGEMVGAREAEAPAYVADCYLCPGNRRV